MSDLFASELSDLIETDVRRNVRMSDHTSFRIGGTADLFFEATSQEQIILAVNWAHVLDVPWIVIGSGTNILVSDEGIRGLIIKNACAKVHVEESRVVTEAGALTSHVVHETLSRGLAGMEFLAGLPGTIGGAVAGNAGCFGRAVGALLEWAVVLEAGKMPIRRYPSWFEFDYRSSILQATQGVLLEASFVIAPGDTEELLETERKNIEFRHLRHPMNACSAGSYFKNLDPPAADQPRVPAGLLLDQAGCMGMKVGDAVVFEKHSNIIVNQGKAKARDILELAEKMKQKVREKFDTELEPEVRFLGNPPSIKKAP